MAEEVRFELTKGLLPCRFSRPVPSTTRPLLQLAALKIGAFSEDFQSFACVNFRERQIQRAEFNEEILIWDADAGTTDFDVWDFDNDGVLDQSEFRTNFNLYDTWDADASATLSVDEVTNSVFLLWDTDGDGSIEESEWVGRASGW